MSEIGRLIVVEGPDGVGKSTLTAALVVQLRAQGLQCRSFAFPGNEIGTLGSLVYRLHHDATMLPTRRPTPAAVQALHIAAHLDAIEQVFRPRLLAGEHLVIDRYWWSTWVYGLVNGVPPEVLDSLVGAERHYWGEHLPLIVFLVDRANPWRAEEDSAEWRRLAQAYRELGVREGTASHVERLPNTGSPEQVARQMARSVEARLAGTPMPQRKIAHGDGQLRLALPRGTTTDRSQPPMTFRRIGGITPTAVFDTYWRFAVERQNIFFRRLAGGPLPWTSDPILQRHRFTNTYRASDRVSQYLIRRVIYEGDPQPTEVFFRTILFKLFNRIQTWELLQRMLGELTAAEFVPGRYNQVLQGALRAGERIYSAAYIMPAAAGLTGRPKHEGHLRLLERMLRDELPERLVQARSLREAFEQLRAYPMIGDFLAYQYVIDLNYSPMLSFSEMEFVVPGPGARSGIRKCFQSLGGLGEGDIIRLVAENQQAEFASRGLKFLDLWGRPLQLIDCQNLFCEVDKYSRVAHPEVGGEGARTRIKQLFRPQERPDRPWFPPKWSLNERVLRGEVIHAPDRG